MSRMRCHYSSTNASSPRQINIRLYVRDLQKAKLDQGGVPDRQHLMEARKDLDKVLAVRPCLRTHLEMAQVKNSRSMK